MTDAPDALLLDLVEWVAREPRSYADAMEVWRTSCPRLPVWEDATDRGFLERRSIEGQGIVVLATDAGREWLRAAGRPAG